MSEPINTKAELLDIVDRVPVGFHVRAWNRDVFLRPISAAVRNEAGSRLRAWDRATEHGAPMPDDYLAVTKARVVIDALCDCDGKAILSRADVPKLLDKSHDAVEQIFDEAMERAGLGDADEEAASTLEKTTT